MTATEDDQQEILISVDSRGVHIVAESVAEELKRKKISASMITGLQKCPAGWAAETFAIRKLVKEDPDNAATRGSLFHTVMEHLFALPASERTPAKVKELLKEALEDPKNVALKNPDAIAWARDAINGYYSMGGRPEKVQVAEVPTKDKDGNLGEKKPGLEIFVRGRLGECSRDTLGFIDRVSVDLSPDAPEDGIVVEDWKSGAKAKRWNPKTKNDEGLAEARQQVIYAMLLEQLGLTVSAARLVFPVAREVVNVDLEDVEFRARVIKDIEDTDKALDHYIETNTFEYKPNFLCSWCPLARVCPSAKLERFEKARAAFRKQPQIDELVKGIEVIE